MEADEYNEIVKNIHENPKFKLKRIQLYKVKDGKLLKVIQKYEVKGLLYMMHNHKLSAHFGIKATQNKIREKYWWIKMMKDIENYVKLYDRFQRRNKPQKKNELSPISVKIPFYQIGINFVEPLPATSIHNYIICKHGCSQKIISDDRCKHFDNKMVELLTKKLDKIIEELPFQRNIAKGEILRSQKEYYDGKGKGKEEFKIGDEVLKYNAAQQNSKSNKLNDKWSELYLIHEILLNEFYKLKELDGKILRNPTNGELLKKYFMRKLK
ncbi:putative integrase core domain protein [Rhizophagus irregularis DAOM 181602=DAOM 197198]|nr:putative integrase core domain protein [Rhizophagus irregularis DAOM 181602=DAOM 197198]